MKNVLPLLFAVLIFSCKNTPEKDPITETDSGIEELYKIMTGSYTNAKQTKTDTAYFDIMLHMAPIWQEREGYWLYVEQSLSDTLEKPYHQYIYQLSRENDSVLRGDIYTFPNESLWAGKWETPEFFDRLLYETLVLKNGCELFLIKANENRFIGKTKGKKCRSDLDEAVYTTTEVEINEHKFVYHQRNFDKNDSLVQNIKRGNYIFNKIAD